MPLRYKKLSRLLNKADLLANLQLQASELVGIVDGFQWLGPHLLTCLRHATEHRWLVGDKPSLVGNRYYLSPWFLTELEDSAAKCIVACGKKEKQKHFKEFIEIIVSQMPHIRGMFMLPKEFHRFLLVEEQLRIFVKFLLETVGSLLNSGSDSSAAVMSSEVKLLLKDLEFLLSFLFDSVVSGSNKISTTAIEDASKEVGIFLCSFFFTTQAVATKEMEQELSLLVHKKIKDHFVDLSKSICGNESLQVAAQGTSETGSSSIPLVEEIINIVGSEDITNKIAERLLGGPKYRQIISIVGMPGLGKTTLAKKLYNDANVQHYFDSRSWCVVSQSYKQNKLLKDLLSSASNLTSEEISTMEDEKLEERLYKSLSGRRYLIMMDDLWDQNVLHDFIRLFPDVNNGSRVLFTSRLKNVGSEASHIMIEPPPLSPNQCWDLLEKKVFKKGSCPQELQSIGKQIAKNCQGLPLSVVTIAGVLSNMEMERSLWQQVAKSSTSYVSRKADDYIPILKLSYIHLPIHLKTCFLYLCAFQEDEEIPVRYLLFQWIAEGFIKQKEQKRLEDVAEEYLMELINRNLLQVAKRRSDNGAKTCILHDLILDMCWKIAVEEEFLSKHQFLISRTLPRFFLDQSDRISDAISIHYNLEKTRILDFPSRLVKCDLETSILPNLSYLQTKKLHSSIDRFRNLVILVVKRPRVDIPNYLLNMPKLRHLYFGIYKASRFGRECDIPRENSLQTLSFIHIFDSEDEKILKHSPELRRLKCTFPQNRFPDLNFLSRLESLSITYKDLNTNLAHTINFPTNIRKLTLAGIGLFWEEMSLIGKLPNLEILKLEYDAFIGETWDTKDDEFHKLKFLEIFHNHLVKWNSSSDHFPILERLVLRFCRRLEAVPEEFSNIPTLEKIEVGYGCSINVKNSALQIREEQQDNGNQDFELSII